MTDVSKMIEPKSDQLNADDLISGPITATITGVEVRGGDQPISVHLDAWHRPWKPCKSMARIMAAVWGRDSSAWVGQGVTLFNDPDVKWAGVAVGGIRLSQMTGINQERRFNQTVSKGKRKPFTVKPLQAAQNPAQQPQQPQTQQSPQQQAQAPAATTQAEIAHHGQVLMGATSMDQLIEAWGKIPANAKKQLESVKNQCKASIEAEPTEQPAPQSDIENF